MTEQNVEIDIIFTSKHSKKVNSLIVFLLTDTDVTHYVENRESAVILLE